MWVPDQTYNTITFTQRQSAFITPVIGTFLGLNRASYGRMGVSFVSDEQAGTTEASVQQSVSAGAETWSIEGITEAGFSTTSTLLTETYSSSTTTSGISFLPSSGNMSQTLSLPISGDGWSDGTLFRITMDGASTAFSDIPASDLALSFAHRLRQESTSSGGYIWQRGVLTSTGLVDLDTMPIFSNWYVDGGLPSTATSEIGPIRVNLLGYVNGEGGYLRAINSILSGRAVVTKTKYENADCSGGIALTTSQPAAENQPATSRCRRIRLGFGGLGHIDANSLSNEYCDLTTDPITFRYTLHTDSTDCSSTGTNYTATAGQCMPGGYKFICSRYAQTLRVIPTTGENFYAAVHAGPTEASPSPPVPALEGHLTAGTFAQSFHVGAGLQNRLTTAQCTAPFTVNSGIGNSCESGGPPITSEIHCRIAALLLGRTFRSVISIDYAPNGCMEYDGSSTQHRGFYVNTHPGSSTGTADHHKVCAPDCFMSCGTDSGCSVGTPRTARVYYHPHGITPSTFAGTSLSMPAEASVQLEKLLENNNELTAEITSILYFVSAMAGGLFMHEGVIVEDWLDGVQKLTRGSEETATGIAAFGSGMAFSDHLFGALEAAIRTYTNNNNRGRWAYTFDAFWGDDQHNNASIHMLEHRDHAGIRATREATALV